jgi:hypothetical protein
MIYNLSPTDTPFMSMIAGRGKARSTNHEWQTDALGAAAKNAVVEGNDAAYATAAATTRIGNYTQISTKTVIVSGTQDSVDKAGRDSDYRYNLAKRMAELKRDMEVVLTGNQTSSAGGTAVARQLGPLETTIYTNYSSGVGNTAQGSVSGSVWTAATDDTAGAQRTITEGMLATAQQQAWSAGGNPEYVMCGPVTKRYISQFSGIATLYRGAEGKTSSQASILGAADVYVGDFGEVRVVPNRFCRERTATVLDSNYWDVSYLRPFKTEKMAKTGDANKALILVEYTLEAKNQEASAKIADLVTSGTP